MSLPEGGGGTFALPSPTHAHAHHMDVTSAVRSLRRSISRSPSRFLRQPSRASDGSAPASPQSPCRRFRLTPQHRQFDQLPLPAHTQSAPPAASYAQGANTSQSNASFTPLRSTSSKLSLRSAAKTSRTSSPSRQLARARNSPKSPLRRALNATSDQSNAAAQQSVFSRPDRSMGQENRVPNSPTQPHRRSADKASRHSLHLDVSGSSENAFLKALDAKGDATLSAGGLKRNDAMMNLDQPYQGSPLPKRRSMHGVSSLEQGGEQRNIFGGFQSPAPASFRIHEDKHRQPEAEKGFGETHSESVPPTPSPGFLKRSSSLRKSSVMPRSTDKNSWGKRVGQRQLANLPSANATPVRSRTPVAKELFEPPSDTPFFGSTTPAFGSTTPAAPPPFQPSIFQVPEAKNHHPLAQIQTLSASSSGNSLGEDISASYAPAPPISRFSKAHPFSQSLPLGAERPIGGNPPLGQATPNQSSLLYHGAFASTGLISKVNRNPEQGDKKMIPPDTPCKPWKKPSERFNTYPTTSTPSTGKKTKTNNRHSCSGISSLTFQPPSAVKPNPVAGTSLFDGRRSIFGRGGGDTELFQESNYEPVSFGTPTKHGMTPSFSNLSNLSELSEQCTDEPNDSPSANRKSHGPPLSAVRPASPLGERHTPRTPHELSLPENTRQLSISIASASNGPFRDSGRLPPATPTSERDFRSSTGAFSTPVHESSRDPGIDTEPSLAARFDEVTKIGGGQFSMVYRVKERAQLGQSPLAERVFVVKKSKRPYQGLKDRERKLREPKILQALRDSEHVVQYIADWEMNDHLYIQTEFCENGTLEDFFLKEGFYGRLDDFCIFKILLDLTLGLKEIHDAGFMHLDMKPANVLVTFEGALKIGDFGLAREISDRKNLDMEGDREYMAPEMLQGKFGRSSDIFSLGIVVFEAMANVVIPGNGDEWHRLRSGDFSGVPSLSWTASSETHPYRSGLYSEDLNRTHDAGDLFGSHKRSELLEPPTFMDATHPESLQSVVGWMMAAAREQRPTASQLLSLESMQWIAQRRKAPATIFEGRWGPIDLEPAVVDVVDTEMTGV